MREGRASPRARRVAGLTCRREELRLRGVSGIRSSVVIGLMACDAKIAVQAVVVVHVAVGAYPWRHRVQSRQWEAGVVVIECRICPVDRVVAHFARSRESSCRMRGRRSARIVLLVAGVAQCAIQRVVVVDVAIDTAPRRHHV